MNLDYITQILKDVSDLRQAVLDLTSENVYLRKQLKDQEEKWAARFHACLASIELSDIGKLYAIVEPEAKTMVDQAINNLCEMIEHAKDGK